MPGRFGSRFRRNFKPGLRTTNHCETSFSTTGGTELQTAVFTSVSGPSNRGAHIPEGSVLKSVFIDLFSTDNTPVTGKHQCMLIKRPGATVFTTGPITNWFLTTDPITEEMIDVRRYAMERHGVSTRYTVTPAVEPLRFRCSWRGNWQLRDGDDVVLSLLDANNTTYIGICNASYIM